MPLKFYYRKPNFILLFIKLAQNYFTIAVLSSLFVQNQQKLSFKKIEIEQIQKTFEAGSVDVLMK